MTFRAIARPLHIAAVASALAWVTLHAAPSGARPQEAAASPPAEHLLGTVTATDPAAKTITVKDDKTGAQSVVSLAQTRTIFRVQPGAKDLKGATRITASDLSKGDRVDVRGSKDGTGPGIIARSVVQIGRAHV